MLLDRLKVLDEKILTDMNKLVAGFQTPVEKLQFLENYIQIE